jgi:hypothetical protein
MSDDIGQEKIAFVSPSETTWCVSVRDGTGLSGGLFTVNRRNYYETVEDANAAAERLQDEGSVDGVRLNVVAQRFLEDTNNE